MELPEAMSQPPRYSWPPSTAPVGGRGITDAKRSPSRSFRDNVTSPRRGSKHKRGTHRLLVKKQSSSCGDLRAESDDNRDAPIGRPPHCADQGAQGDGIHNQPKPKKVVTFCEETQGIRHLSTEHGQVNKNEVSRHEEVQEKNKDVGRYLNKNSSTTVDHDSSDRYLTSVNAFLRSIASDDIELNSKNGDARILDAIRAGMALELKRKGGSNETEVATSEQDGAAAAHEVAKMDAGGYAHVNAVPQRKAQDTALAGGDDVAQRENRGDVQRHQKTNRVEHVETCCVKTSANTREECESEKDNATARLAGVCELSNSDSSCCELEYDLDEHTFVKKPTYPRCEDAICDDLLRKETEMQSDVEEIGNTPVGNNQKRGHALPQKKDFKRVLANEFAGALSTVYRVELEADDFDGKIFGTLCLPVAGENMQTRDNVLAEQNAADTLQGSPTDRLLEANIVGKVFTVKIVSLASDEDERPDVATAAAETKRSPDAAAAVSDFPNPSACSLCLVEFTSLHHARSHYNGKAHGKRAFVISCARSFHCDACNITYTSRKHEEQHVRGRKHRSRVASLKEPAPRVTSPRSPTKCQVEPPVRVTAPLVCGLCSITTNSRENLIDHFNSLKHLKKVETLKKTTCQGKESPAEGGQPTQQVVANTAASPSDVSTISAQASWKKTPAVTHKETTATYVAPMPITFQVPKSKFNLSHLKKMVRTVGTQFTNTHRDGEAERPSCRAKASDAESNCCHGAGGGAPPPGPINVFGGRRRPAGCKAVGCRGWKSRAGTM